MFEMSAEIKNFRMEFKEFLSPVNVGMRASVSISAYSLNKSAFNSFLYYDSFNNKMTIINFSFLINLIRKT